MFGCRPYRGEMSVSTKRLASWDAAPPSTQVSSHSLWGAPMSKVKSRKSKTKRTHSSRKADAKPKTKLKVRSFPNSTFEAALELGLAIQKHNGGEKVRRIRIFESLGKSPESGTSRTMVTNSGKYEITRGSYKAEHLELTKDGNLASNHEVDRSTQLRARFKLAIAGIEPFSDLYEKYKDRKLPTQSFMRDFLQEAGSAGESVNQCAELFVINAKFLGLLKTIAGAERLFSLEHVLEDMGTSPQKTPNSENGEDNGSTILRMESIQNEDSSDWDRICFYLTPIGDPETPERKHADLFLNSLVEPALEEFDLKVIRADQIEKPGMITQQVLEHTIKSKLVIADLSFNNPNVFYELCGRHMSRRPLVQLIRKQDRIPFDIGDFRTIIIDTTDIYTLVPHLETYKAEIANQARQVLADPQEMQTPISTFWPDLKLDLGQELGIGAA